MIWKRANMPTRHWQRGGDKRGEGGREWMNESQRVFFQTGVNMFWSILFSIRTSQNSSIGDGMYGAIVSALSVLSQSGPTHRLSHITLLRKSLCIRKMLPGNTPADHIFYSVSVIRWLCQIFSQIKWWRRGILSTFGWKLVAKNKAKQYSLINLFHIKPWN